MNVSLISWERIMTLGKWWVAFVQDARTALRQWRRSPALAGCIIGVVAFGVALSAGLFSFRRAIGSRPAPGITDDASRVRLRAVAQREGDRLRARAMTHDEVRAYASRTDVFADVQAWTGDVVVIGAQERGRAVAAEFVTPGYFALLGVRPVAGSFDAFTADEATVTVAVSHAFWQTELGGNRDIMGRPIRVNDVTAVVAAVLPPAFAGVDPTYAVGGQLPHLWLPQRARSLVTTHAAAPADEPIWSAIARVRPSVTYDGATAAATAIAAAVASNGHPRAETWSTSVVRIRAGSGDPRYEAKLSRLDAGIAAMIVLVMLIAGSNGTTLLLGRAVERRREVGVRLALGATRGRIARQLLVEGLMLGGAGAAAGLVILAGTQQAIARRLPAVAMPIDPAVIGFGAIVAAAVGLMFGVWPALRTTHSAAALIKSATGGRGLEQSLLQRAFVVVQVALSVPMLVAIGGLLAYAWQGLSGATASLDRERVVSLSVNTYSRGASRWNVRLVRERLVERLGAMPGVVSVAAYEPKGGGSVEQLVAGTGALPDIEARVVQVSPGYFRTLGVPVLRGREFDSRDSVTATIPIVVGSEFAARVWGDGDPVGERLKSRRRANREYVVVGVASTTDEEDHEHRERVVVYSPEASDATIIIPRLLVRTVMPGQRIAQDMKAVVRALDPSLPEATAITLAEIDRSARANFVRLATASAIGGAVVLAFACVGLAAVIALAVRARWREIGVRVAIGATSPQVVRLFVLQGLRLSIVGTVLGTPLTLLALPLIFGEIPLATGVALTIYIGTALVVLLLTTMAIWIPARRAALVTPSAVLQMDV